MTKEDISQKLIELFSGTDRAFKLVEIAKILGFRSDSDDYFLMKEVLEMLCEQEIVEKAKRRTYKLATDNFSGIIGKIEIYDGQGTVASDNPQMPSVVVKRDALHTALNGDIVEVRLLASVKKKKPRAEVVRIVERSDAPIVGKIDYDGYFYFLVPSDKNHHIDFLIPQKKLNGARHGDKVSAVFTVWEDPSKSPKAEVTKILGTADDPRVEYDSILDEFQLPTKFSKEVLREASQFKPPTNRKPAGRLDMRKETVITIDPEDAKDFDDALSLKILDNGNYMLGVHIADVSHYVKENSAIDIEARTRATSIYLVDRVIPMLPEELSNNICSLNPDLPRLTFSVFAELTSECEVVNYTIEETIIKNSRRFNYDEIQDIIDTGKGDLSDLILSLHNLTHAMRAKRFREGGIQFDTVEYKFKLDENYFPTEVKIKKTTEATALVEECMLLANQIVAGHVSKIQKSFKLRKELPYLYRIHEEPDQKLLKTALKFVSTFGPKISKKTVTSKDLNELLLQAEDMPEKNIIHQVIIRSMPKAIYSDRNFGHYGLGFAEYSHFTSPIRRYPDLYIHRLLKEYLKGKPDSKRLDFLAKLSKDVANQSSGRERLALDAERASNKVALSIIADHHLGEEFTGLIVGVTSFGLFVQLDEIYVEGLLHIKDMQDDYYVFDETNYRIIGKRRHKIYKLGGSVRVRIAKVNIARRQVDLAYVSD